MKEVLFIAYYFPPIATSGAMRPLAFCRYLREFGWQVRVVAADPFSVRPTLATDQFLAQQIAPDVMVRRVAHRNIIETIREKVGDAGRRIGSRNGDSLQPGVALEPSEPKRGRLAGIVRTGVRHVMDFPDDKRSWYWPASRAALEMCAEYRPNAVLATGGPWTSLLVGCYVSSMLGVPLVSDFRDPWARNPFHHRDPLLRWRTKRLEQWVVARSAAAIANTDPLRAQFEADYPSIDCRFETITNGFDSAGLEDLGKQCTVADETTSARDVELTHFGSVYGHRSPVNLLRAVADLEKENQALRGTLRIRFVGTWDIEDSGCNQLADELALSGTVVREGEVSHAECMRQMRQARILLLLQGSSPLQIPGKTFEYIASQRPIFLVGGEGATAQLLKSQGFGVQCENSVPAIKALLRTLLSGGVATGNEPILGSSLRFDYRRLTERLANLLDYVTSGEPMVKTTIRV